MINLGYFAVAAVKLMMDSVQGTIQMSTPGDCIGGSYEMVDMSRRNWTREKMIEMVDRSGWCRLVGAV